ncbi:FUSC family protein [Enemella dayhoffiae]|uniref:FUSC family protein n=1 Tax=Enemella dayhoffiae TaxID=2016507 RepID=A0A255GUQ9_9ACTN|nr:FUSC family protein [Enemella dayhoffiae]OYO19361.1 FUSC family protein [Enemella dayhoffiae]
MVQFSWQRLALRAFDFSERSVRRGRDSQRRRVERWRNRLFMICQCAVTAGAAWWVSQKLIGDPLPVFAPVAAVITIGSSFGQRLSRAAEVAAGVALGVFFGDLFVHFFGTGVWQIVLVVLLAMSVATWVGAKNLMITQAGVQSIIVMTLLPGAEQGLGRWLTALVGCALALLVTTIAPTSPLTRPRQLAAEVLREAAGTLTEIRDALTDGDPEAGDRVLTRARLSEGGLERLNDAVDEGLAVVRLSPFARGNLPHLEELSAIVDPLDRMSRNLRVLARRSAVALYRGETIPPAYLSLMGDLAEQMTWCAGELQARRLPEGIQERMEVLGERSSHLRMTNSLSAVVLLAQMRSIMVDLVQLSGVSYADARELIPEMD